MGIDAEELKIANHRVGSFILPQCGQKSSQQLVSILKMHQNLMTRTLVIGLGVDILTENALNAE